MALYRYKVSSRVLIAITVKSDDSGQISHINHISTSSMKKPLLVRPVHGVTAAWTVRGELLNSGLLSLPLLKVPATAALCRSFTAIADWVKKPVHGVKKKLDFEGSGDPCTSRLHGGMSKRNKQEAGHSSSACDVSVSDVTNSSPAWNHEYSLLEWRGVGNLDYSIP